MSGLCWNNFKRILNRHLFIFFVLKCGIDFVKKASLEFIELILVKACAHIIKTDQLGLGKHIFKVCDLFLKQWILSDEASIFLINLFCNFLELLKPLLKLFLIVILSHSASDSTLSVLHPPKRFLNLIKILTSLLSCILEDHQCIWTHRFCLRWLLASIFASFWRVWELNHRYSHQKPALMRYKTSGWVNYHHWSY